MISPVQGFNAAAPISTTILPATMDGLTAVQKAVFLERLSLLNMVYAGDFDYCKKIFQEESYSRLLYCVSDTYDSSQKKIETEHKMGNPFANFDIQLILLLDIFPNKQLKYDPSDNKVEKCHALYEKLFDKDTAPFYLNKQLNELSELAGFSQSAVKHTINMLKIKDKAIVNLPDMFVELFTNVKDYNSAECHPPLFILFRLSQSKDPIPFWIKEIINECDWSEGFTQAVNTLTARQEKLKSFKDKTTKFKGLTGLIDRIKDELKEHRYGSLLDPIRPNLSKMETALDTESLDTVQLYLNNFYSIYFTKLQECEKIHSECLKKFESRIFFICDRMMFGKNGGGLSQLLYNSDISDYTACNEFFKKLHADILPDEDLTTIRQSLGSIKIYSSTKLSDPKLIELCELNLFLTFCSRDFDLRTQGSLSSVSVSQKNPVYTYLLFTLLFGMSASSNPVDKLDLIKNYLTSFNACKDAFATKGRSIILYALEDYLRKNPTIKNEPLIRFLNSQDSQGNDEYSLRYLLARNTREKQMDRVITAATNLIRFDQGDQLELAGQELIKEKKYEAALKIFTTLKNNTENSKFQAIIGLFHALGRGTPQNFAAAKEAYQSAIEKGEYGKWFLCHLNTVENSPFDPTLSKEKSEDKKLAQIYLSLFEPGKNWNDTQMNKLITPKIIESWRDTESTAFSKQIESTIGTAPSNLNQTYSNKYLLAAGEKGKSLIANTIIPESDNAAWTAYKETKFEELKQFLSDLAVDYLNEQKKDEIRLSLQEAHMQLERFNTEISRLANLNDVNEVKAVVASLFQVDKDKRIKELERLLYNTNLQNKELKKSLNDEKLSFQNYVNDMENRLSNIDQKEEKKDIEPQPPLIQEIESLIENSDFPKNTIDLLWNLEPYVAKKSDVLKLLKAIGFHLDREVGSHKIFKCHYNQKDFYCTITTHGDEIAPYQKNDCLKAIRNLLQTKNN